eukprot:8696383-Alexandrium_andersonii.AAC.1
MSPPRPSPVPAPWSLPAAQGKSTEPPPGRTAPEEKAPEAVAQRGERQEARSNVPPPGPPLGAAGAPRELLEAGEEPDECLRAVPSRVARAAKEGVGVVVPEPART